MKGILWGMGGAVVIAALASLPKPGAGGDPTIAAAQTFLRAERLYPGEITGARDRETEAAIRRFQMLRRLRVTGMLDGPTRAGMRLPAAAPTPSLPWIGSSAQAEADRRFLEHLEQAAPSPPSPPAAPAPVAEASPRPGRKEPPPPHAPRHRNPRRR